MIDKIWVLNAILLCAAIFFVSMLIPLNMNANVVSELSCTSNTGANLSIAECCYALKTQCGFHDCDLVKVSGQLVNFCKVVYS